MRAGRRPQSKATEAQKPNATASPPTSPLTRPRSGAGARARAAGAAAATAGARAPQGNPRMAEQVGKETIEWLFIYTCGSLFTASILAAPVIVKLLVEWAAGSNPQTD